MIKISLYGLVGIIPYLAVAFGLLFVYKALHDAITRYDDREELRRDNSAAGLTRAGAYLGVVIAMGGSLINSDLPMFIDFAMFALDGVFAVVIFTVATFAFDWAILWKNNNAKQVAAGNKAVAIVEACAFVALGIIMNASFSGGGGGFWTGMLSALVFSIIGLATLLVIYLVFVRLYRWRYHCDVEREVEDGNEAMALEAGGVLLAMSITLWCSISGDFFGWILDILSYAIAALSSVVAVGLAWFISGRVFTGVASVNPDGTHTRNRSIAYIRMFLLVAWGLIAGLVTFS